MSYPTSRRYARTLAQAWPRDYACAIERHPASCRIGAWALAVGVGAMFGCAIVVWLAGG